MNGLEKLIEEIENHGTEKENKETAIDTHKEKKIADGHKAKSEEITAF